MRTLARQLLLDFIGPFLLALLVLTFILLMDKLFLMVDLLVRKGISPAVVGELVLLSLPFVMSISTPLAMLIAAVMSYGRASQDNEIAALRTAGIPVFRVFVPVLILGVLLWAVMLYFNGFVVANANLRLRNLMMDITTKRPAVRVESGVFMTDFEGYSIYIGAIREKTSRVTDVRIYDRTRAGAPDLITAPTGRIGTTPDEKYLTLTLDSATTHQYIGDDKYRRLISKEVVINLPLDADLLRRDREYRGNREMTLLELTRRTRSLNRDIGLQRKTVRDILARGKLNQADSVRLSEERTKLRYKLKEQSRYIAESSKRYSLAFSCFLFLFFGAPLGILLRRGGLGTGFLVGLLFFAAFYILLLVGEELTGSGKLSPFFGMWLANVALFPVTLELAARTLFEYSFLDRIRAWLRNMLRGRAAVAAQTAACHAERKTDR